MAGPGAAVARPLTWRRRFRRYVTYLAIRAFLGFLWALPLRVSRGIGRTLGWLAWTLVRRERARALAHVAAAFPDRAPAEQRHIARGAFLALGDSVAELAHVDRLRRRFDTYVDCDPQSRAALEAALSKGRGVLIIAGHIGNWELLALYLAWCGCPLRTLARAASDPRLSAFVRRFRESRGVQCILRHEDGAPKAMLRAFRDNAALGFLIDQDTDVAGVHVPFFGRPAWTPSGAAALALRTGAAVLVVTMQRLRDGRHAASFEPYEVHATGERDADLLRITAELTAMLEAAIRREPSQWVWMHQRWKR